jgi:CRP/FNR family transcriptional regulator, anaerobic regulatory protein
MRVDCTHCPLRRLEHFLPMSKDEVLFMQDFKIGELEVERGTVLLLEGSNSPQLYTVLRGMGLRYKSLADGSRQVLNFVFPGDFLGLQAGLMQEMQHSVEASTKMTLCVFDRKSLWRLFRDQPSRAFDLTWIAAAAEHFLGDALATVGQKNAEARVAWALVRIFTKCQALEIATENSCPLPFRQQDLADALGLSLVHTNKTLARFRERQLAMWHAGTLRIPDIDRLSEVGMVEDVERRSRPLL